MSQIENIKVSLQIPFSRDDEGAGINFLRKLQALPFPKRAEEPPEKLVIVIGDSSSLPCYVTQISTTYSRELGVENGMPLFADIEMELLLSTT